jgi:hypothetical protein
MARERRPETVFMAVDPDNSATPGGTKPPGYRVNGHARVRHHTAL